MGGGQSGKGSEQVESYYIIASIKPLAVVKPSAFQRLYFLLSLLNPPLFLFLSFCFLSLFSFFTALFLGGGGQGGEPREGIWSGSYCLVGFLRSPPRSKVRQQEHSRPPWPTGGR